MELQQLATLVEVVEAESLADAVAALPEAAAAEMGAVTYRIGSTACTGLRRVDLTLFNRIVGFGVREPVTEDAVEALVSRFQAAGTSFMVQLSPAAQPPDRLPRWLKQRGLTRGDDWAKMFRSLEEPPAAVASDLRLERVGREGAPAVAEIMLEGARELGAGAAAVLPACFSSLVGRDGWHHYLAFDGDTPVAAARLFVRGPVAGLFGAVTRPSHRRRGAQGLLLAQRIRDAAAMGCRWAVTEGVAETPDRPNPSYRNMIRAGFRLAYLRPNYVWQSDGRPAKHPLPARAVV